MMEEMMKKIIYWEKIDELKLRITFFIYHEGNELFFKGGREMNLNGVLCSLEKNNEVH